MGMPIAGLCIVNREMGQRIGYPSGRYVGMKKADTFEITIVAKVKRVYSEFCCFHILSLEWN